jgi:hypothetical protein
VTPPRPARQAWQCPGQVPNAVFPRGSVASEVDDEGIVPASAVVQVRFQTETTVGCGPAPRDRARSTQGR